MSTINKTTADQLALSTGSFVGDTLGAALGAWKQYTDVSLHKKLVDAQIDQASLRGSAPIMGGANRTGYAGAGAYFPLPAGSETPQVQERSTAGWPRKDVELAAFAIAMVGLLFLMGR